MGLRTSLRGTWFVTLPVLGFLVWVLLKWFAVFDAVDSFWTLTSGSYVGHAAASGIVGLIVMAVFAVLLVVLYGELGELTPAPSSWPPEE